MANHWAVIIGINQYRFFQPLNYAQQDAQALHTFLISEAGFVPEQCLLLTEASPPIQGRPTYPTQENIEGCIQEICQQRLQPGDILWCFFSGYGICVDQQDYLMPIDGNPDNVPATGISVRSLYESFKVAAQATILVLLDVSRSQAAKAAANLGTESLELARSLEIPTILSCQPGEFSHESSVLRQGFFTAALISGLRAFPKLTLAQLDRYLSNSLPQLNEYHWHPLQHPMTVVASPAMMQQVILPQPATLTPTALGISAVQRASNRLLEIPVTTPTDPTQTYGKTNVGAAGSATSVATRPPEVVTASQTQLGGAPPDDYHEMLSQLIGNARVADSLPSNTATLVEPALDSRRDTVSNVSTSGYTNTQGISESLPSSSFPGATMTSFKVEPTPVSIAPPPSEVTEPEMEDVLFWRPMLWRGGVVVALLFVGVVLRNQVVFTAPRSPQPSTLTTPTPSVTQLPTVSPSPLASSSPTLPRVSPSPIASPSTSPIASPSASPTPSTLPIAPSPSEIAASPLAPASPTPGTGNPSPALAGNPASAPTEKLLTTAFAELQNQNYQEALRLLSQVPAKERTRVYVLLRSQAEAQASQALLSEAKVILTPNLASRFNDAIKKARQVSPTQPLYDQAQQYIDRWSLVILDLAEGRVKEGNYQQAIAAAQLVPDDRKEIYAQAQAAIAQWQKEEKNLAILLEAGGLIQPELASSYNQAIVVAKQIQAGEPKYPQAQRLIEQWSRSILVLAEERAAQGKFRRAIEAADLVPDTTPAYIEAQQAIANWKQKL